MDLEWRDLIGIIAWHYGDWGNLLEKNKNEIINFSYKNNQSYIHWQYQN